MEKEHKGDSYVVNTTPASSTFQAVRTLLRSPWPSRCTLHTPTLHGRFPSLAIFNDNPIVADYRSKAAPKQ